MKSPTLLFLSIAFLVISSCDIDKTPLDPDKSDYEYPMTIGNQWEYQRTFSNSILNPDTLTVSSGWDTTTISIVTIKIAREEVIHDSISTYVFQETLEENNQSIFDESYYANVEGDLYFYAYRNGGYVIPKAVTKKRVLFNGIYFANVREITEFITKRALPNYALVDSLIYEDPPLLSIKYPLQRGSQWTYRFPGMPWRIDKRVLGRALVKVPAGQFHCFKIQWLHDLNNDGNWDDNIIFYDYVCEQGLVKRSVLFKNVIMSSADSPDQIGLMDTNDESVLTKVNLENMVP